MKSIFVYLHIHAKAYFLYKYQNYDPAIYVLHWVNCQYFDLLVTHMRFICSRFCLLCNKPIH